MNIGGIYIHKTFTNTDINMYCTKLKAIARNYVSHSVNKLHVLKYFILYLSKEIINDTVVKHWTESVSGQTVAVRCSWFLSKPVSKEKPTYQN